MAPDLAAPMVAEAFDARMRAWGQERVSPAAARSCPDARRVVERLERAGAGLNLTEQVRDGIACHSGRAPEPATLEGKIVRVVDRVAYINHDIDDALRAGVLAVGDLPADAIAALGDSGS